jgi:DNA invertase Pin-like site-specific DNA recombinase
LRIGYGRLSDDSEAPTQRQRLLAAGCETVILDRPEKADRLLQTISSVPDRLGRRRPILVVCSLDRLARSIKELFAVVDQLSKAGIELVSLDEGWHLSATSGQETMRTIADLVRFQKSIAAEKSKKGLRSAEDKDRLTGRPRTIDPDTLATVAGKIGDGTLTVAEAARDLGVAPSTVYRHLASRRSLE